MSQPLEQLGGTKESVVGSPFGRFVFQIEEMNCGDDNTQPD